MENKISTSIQYLYTNVKLFNEVFYNWPNFNEQLKLGPENMKEYFLKEWNELKERLKKDEKIEVKDLDKIVTKDSFDITFNKTESGIPIFFFTFPDYEYNDAASKYVALILTSKMPRYFTLEYSEHTLSKKRCFVLGEFLIDEETKKTTHKNYGTVEDDRLAYFAGLVINMIEKEDK